MIDLIEVEKSFVTPHIKKGGVCADFTMGNGNDTLWLSRAVGAEGRVFSFDIQPAALESTSRLLESTGADKNYTLICDSHANAEKYIDKKICAGLFNLGYLPGGDRRLTTLCTSTRAAVEAALRLLDDDGILLIAIYPGHDEGTREGIMLDGMLSELDRHEFCVFRLRIINSPTSPFFIAVEKK